MMGPIEVAAFREHLHEREWRCDLPKGLGGSPVNLLCREFLRRGARLVIFTLDPSVTDEVRIEGPSLRICIGPFRARRARDFFSEERRFLTRAIRRERPDLLHAHWTYEYALAAQAARLPHVITAHDAPINVLRHNFIPYRVARTVMAYRAISWARTIVSVSPYVANHLKKFMLYRGPPLVVPNGLPDEAFAPPSRPRPVSGGVIFATILNGAGRLKNGVTAIDAFARVRSRRPGDRLLMFGQGYGEGEPAALWARRRGIAHGIEFVGAVTHREILCSLKTKVDVLVHPSLEESQSMAVAEAMAAGLPVIGGHRSGGVPWTLAEGRAGVLVDVSSADAIADAMMRLAESENARSELASRARDHAQLNFRVEAVADAYAALYEEALGSA
jgi:glycosyltransferase involved in cell wall biosynthesis